MSWTSRARSWNMFSRFATGLKPLRNDGPSTGRLLPNQHLELPAARYVASRRGRSYRECGIGRAAGGSAAASVFGGFETGASRRQADAAAVLRSTDSVAVAFDWSTLDSAPEVVLNRLMAASNSAISGPNRDLLRAELVERAEARGEVSPHVTLPDHSIESEEPMPPRQGRRVFVQVQLPISRAQCRALIQQYRPRGAPDGQVAIRLTGQGALCVENFDGAGVVVHDWMFK